MSESTEAKRFEEYPTKVDCNECQRYWDNSCDAVPQGSERRCTSFLATREIVIPGQIKDLQRRTKCLKWLAISVILTDIALMAHILTHMLGGY